MYDKKIGWEWIAGFFEGEGHIYWQDGKQGTKQGTCGRLIIGQKDKRPLTAIYGFLIANGFHTPQFYLRPASKNKRSTPCWILTVSIRDDVIRMLSAISPYLFQKKDKAHDVVTKLTRLCKERDAILEAAMKLKQDGSTWREISRTLHCSRVSIMNYAKSKGIDLRRPVGFDNEVDWRKDRIARGLCSICGQPRGDNGTKWKCRKCADKYNLWRNNHRRLYGRKDKRAKAFR